MVGKWALSGVNAVFGYSADSLAPLILLLPTGRCAHSLLRDHGKEVFVHEKNVSISCSFNPLHYGTKPGLYETSIIHFPTSGGVSERMSERSERASERVSAAEGASEVSSPEQANE